MRSWESMDYIGRFEKCGEVKIGVPMSCVVRYNSMVFFCRSTIEQVPEKEAIRDWQEYEYTVREL